MLDELLELSVGKVRELLAYADADMDFEDWVNNCLDEDDFPVDEEVDWGDEDCDEVEEDDYWEDDDEEESILTPSEEELAHQIADDIASQAYSLSTINGLYSGEFVERVRQLL